MALTTTNKEEAQPSKPSLKIVPPRWYGWILTFNVSEARWTTQMQSVTSYADMDVTDKRKLPKQVFRRYIDTYIGRHQSTYAGVVIYDNRFKRSTVYYAAYHCLRAHKAKSKLRHENNYFERPRLWCRRSKRHPTVKDAQDDLWPELGLNFTPPT